MTHDEILTLAKAYAAARSVLVKRTERVREQQTAIVRKYMHGIRNAVAYTAACRDDLHAAIEAHPGLFLKPRTRSVEGVKYGLRKMPGKVVIADTEATAARLRKRLGTEAATYVSDKTTAVFARDALKTLDAKTLAAVGVTVIDDTDVPTIAVPRDGLDKLVDTLLDGLEEDGE